MTSIMQKYGRQMVQLDPELTYLIDRVLHDDTLSPPKKRTLRSEHQNVVVCDEVVVVGRSATPVKAQP